MTFSLSQFIRGRDIFGHKIGVNFRGNETFQTLLGSLFTLTFYTFAAINFVQLSTAFMDGSKQTSSSYFSHFERYDREPYDLDENQVEIYLT